MPIPSLKDQFAALIAAPSVSCTQAHWDQTNRPVIDLLAGWLSDLGFACEIQQITPGKFNLPRTYNRPQYTPGELQDLESGQRPGSHSRSAQTSCKASLGFHFVPVT